MEKTTQDNNIIKLTTPLGKDVLHLTKFDIQEGISMPFLITIACYSNGEVIDKNSIIGKSVTISLDYVVEDSSQTRYFNGVVSHIQSLGSRISKVADGHKYQDYNLTIVPSLHFLKQRYNCRIFQNLKVDEIVKSILSEHSVQVTSELKSSYQSYIFKVQYDESDFDFVHRLLEENGIYYFIEHSDGSHKLVLADSLASYRDATPAQVIHTSGSLTESHIHAWNDNLQIPSGSVINRGYDFLKPQVKPAGIQKNTALAKQQQSGEVFQYYAGSEYNPQLQGVANIALEALQKESALFHGQSTCAGFSTGHCFTFKDTEDPQYTGSSYLITRLNLTVSINSQTGASKQMGHLVHNSFSCIPKDVLFRPSRLTKKPVIHGIQTALVTGDPGEEVYVDKYGRIKVLFHWDREGKSDSSSSCWIRVAQQWAGDRFGAYFSPRVGQEVLISFLDGDPDQPVVIGSLHNADQMPPYSMPDKKSQSGIKTHSTKGGGASNFNEIRFDDDKGNELLYIQAEKDWQSEIKNDRTEKVAKNQTLDVGENLSETVGKNLTIDVGENQSETVGKNLVIDVGKNVDLKAGSKITIKAGGASITLSSSGSIDIKGTSISINGTAIALKAPSIALN